MYKGDENMNENNKGYEKGTLGWLREQAKKYGFDDLGKWNQWKRSKRHQKPNKQCQTINEVCNNCKKRKLEVGSRYRERDKEGKFTGYWVCKNCNNYYINNGKYYHEYGSLEWYDELVEKYGKEFADWAWQNRYKMPSYILNAGCKTDKEYRDKKAQDAGFKDRQDREDRVAQLLGFKDEANRYGYDKRKTKEYQEEMTKRAEFRRTREYRDAKARDKGLKDDNERRNIQRWESGKVRKMEEYEECESHIGCIIGEDNIAKPTLDKIFELVKKKKYNNQGYEFLCKNPRQEFLNRYSQFKLERDKEYRIDVKTSHYLTKEINGNKYGYWKYRIDYNKIADYFLLLGLEAWDETYFSLFIHKDELIRHGKGINSPKLEFWRRDAIVISEDRLSELGEYILGDSHD